MDCASHVRAEGRGPPLNLAFPRILAINSFPRFRHPVLHKLYVLRELANPNEPAEGDVCAEFLQELLPALEQRLFEK